MKYLALLLLAPSVAFATTPHGPPPPFQDGSSESYSDSNSSSISKSNSSSDSSSDSNSSNKTSISLSSIGGGAAQGNVGFRFSVLGVALGAEWSAKDRMRLAVYDRLKDTNPDAAAHALCKTDALRDLEDCVSLVNLSKGVAEPVEPAAAIPPPIIKPDPRIEVLQREVIALQQAPQQAPQQASVDPLASVRAKLSSIEKVEIK